MPARAKTAPAAHRNRRRASTTGDYTFDSAWRNIHKRQRLISFKHRHSCDRIQPVKVSCTFSRSGRSRQAS